MVQRINATRAAHGLPALAYSPSLSRSSDRYAGKLMRSDRFGHASRIQASSAFNRLGEVLAIHSGWSARVGGTVGSWLRSPGHRRLVLSRSMRQVGAGKARGRFGRRLMTIWVVQVGRR